mmetsp:Transcript_39453/g.109593  ORF Transcript_39453/g.109593 Transcript_39453/m.109593 type:complete len:266 (+) Transcript_39453:116-913(+)
MLHPPCLRRPAPLRYGEPPGRRQRSGALEGQLRRLRRLWRAPRRRGAVCGVRLCRRGLRRGRLGRHRCRSGQGRRATAPEASTRSTAPGARQLRRGAGAGGGVARAGARLAGRLYRARGRRGVGRSEVGGVRGPAPGARGGIPGLRRGAGEPRGVAQQRRGYALPPPPERPARAAGGPRGGPLPGPGRALLPAVRVHAAGRPKPDLGGAAMLRRLSATGIRRRPLARAPQTLPAREREQFGRLGGVRVPRSAGPVRPAGSAASCP